MERISLDDVDSRMGPADVKRPLSDPLGLDDVALNYYGLAPGDSFAFGYHRHTDQTEAFVVQRGTVTFETEEGQVTVGAGESVSFDAGQWQRGTNEGDERVVALALGAPREAGRTEMLRTCPDCDARTENRIETTDDRDALVTRCEQCGAETGRFT